MIRAITFTAENIKKEPQSSANSDNDVKKKLAQKGRYHDPLNHWSVKTALYSNELGAAINEIAPTLGLVLWVPTFMYMGADIYDKYKNDKDQYNPSSKRGVKRAVFQTFSTLVLPAMALYVGQKAASPFGMLSKRKLSLNAMDETYNHCKHFLTQCPNDTLENYDKFSTQLQNSLKNRINSLKTEHDKSNIFKKIGRYFSTDYSLIRADKNSLEKFAGEHAKKLFEYKEALESNKRPKGLSSKLFNEFSKEKYWQGIYGKDYIPQALKFTLKKYEKQLMFRTKLLKTAGGVGALLLLTKPIDYFTKHVLMDKLINPGIDMLTAKEFHKKHVVKNLLENKNQPKTSNTPDVHSTNTTASKPTEEAKDLAPSKVPDVKTEITPPTETLDVKSVKKSANETSKTK